MGAGKLEDLQTSEDAGRAVADASSGECWEHAIATGIDMTLLLRNLRRSPAERIKHAAAHLRAVAAIQARTVPLRVRVSGARERRAMKVRALEAIVGQ